MSSVSREGFVEFARRSRHGLGPGVVVAVPLCVRVLSDQLTPVLAYRRLVAQDERAAPSFLFESVEGGERQGRYSILGARPVCELVAYQYEVEVRLHGAGSPSWTAGRRREIHPLDSIRKMASDVVLRRGPWGDGELPGCALGGWVGYAGYDSARYGEEEKLGFERGPRDDRGLPDVHFALYDGVVAFDHVDKLVYVVKLALVREGDDAGAVFDTATAWLEERVTQIQAHSKPLALGRVEGSAGRDASAATSNMTFEQFDAMVGKAKEYIRAGDVFQVVLGQRFERRSKVDPFDVYRALRAVNPSPYMAYMQCAGSVLVASSPEILCRVRAGADGRRIVTNRPLAGTRRRGRDAAEDVALERELLADPKERAEHVMLVDLGRNDLGRVCVPGSIRLAATMEVERYSHVMHISSTIEGDLRAGLDAWDALAATLPVGTISGAPKIRAMQIIDELESVKRGPYGGGIGLIGLDGQMDIALALRTMVARAGAGGEWVYHLQAAAGIVADSVASAEYQETVNKAAALGRAIDLAEAAFGRDGKSEFGRGPGRVG
jgi:anthranilate synthase component I